MAPRTDTRADLLAATRAALVDGGLTAVTAREVAGRANANLASIGYHFGSLHDLLAGALVQEVEELVAPVLTLLAVDADPASRATEAVALLNQVFDTARARVPAFLAALAAAPHDEAVRMPLAALLADVRGRLAVDIERQATDGGLAPWVDPTAMAALIVSVVVGVTVGTALEPAPPPGTDHASVAAQFLFLLLAARSPA